MSDLDRVVSVNSRVRVVRKLENKPKFIFYIRPNERDQIHGPHVNGFYVLCRFGMCADKQHHETICYNSDTDMES